MKMLVKMEHTNIKPAPCKAGKKGECPHAKFCKISSNCTEYQNWYKQEYLKGR